MEGGSPVANPGELMRIALEKLDSLEGARPTKARRTILDAILAAGPHVDMEAIASEVRRLDPGIGKATIYRTLSLLVESGLLVERSFGQERKLYEWADRIVGTHHDHLICQQCGCIVEFQDESIEDIQTKIASTFGFTLEGHSMVLYGICPCCQKGVEHGTPQCPSAGLAKIASRKGPGRKSK